MDMKYFVMLTLLISVSCHQKKEEVANEELLKSDTNRIQSIVNFYGLPSGKIGKNFTFFRDQHFDSSFLLTMHEYPDGVTGIYHEVYPRNKERAEGVEYFEGFRFLVDSATWKKIRMNSTVLLDTLYDGSDFRCLDCAEYLLGVDGRYTFRGKNNEAAFHKFEIFLKNEAINTIRKKKKD